MNVNRSIQRFMASTTSASAFLFFAALLAAIIANSPLAPYYQEFLGKSVSFEIGGFNLFAHNGHALTVLDFVNDALMTIFFLMVGLEIKRELLVGEISTVRKASLPIIAACGGMVLPVLVYTFICSQNGGVGSEGLAIPMATDIAFSLGVLSLLGKRVPLCLKIFLTAFAVVDDIGGIIVIALFYSSHVSVIHLLLAFGALFILFLGNRYHVRNKTFYLMIGFVVWYFLLQSGIHATISGVLVALMIPAKPRIKIGPYIEGIRRYISKFPHSENDSIILDNEQIETLKRLESASDRVISPLQSLEDNLHISVNFLILPLFAFCNAGVVLSGGIADMFAGVSLAVALGLIVGKFTGIYLFTYAAIKTKLIPMPVGMTWKNLTGIAMLGGIGFTVALFIANLSFGDAPELLNQAKLGVLFGSIISGVIGYFMLNFTLPKEAACNMPVNEACGSNH